MNARTLDVTGARKRRRRQQFLRRALRTSIVVLVLAVVAAAGWIVGFSSVFSVKSVEVRGTAVLSTDQVLAAADVPMGTPLARLDTKPIHDRVAALRPVASVDVSRVLPGTVVVTVHERQPVYVLHTPVGLRLVDGTGIPYADVSEAPQGLLPVTVTIEATQRILADVATVIAAIPDDLRRRAAAVEVTSVDHIAFRLDNGAWVVWGSAEQSQAKASVVTALLKIPASTYDVSAPGHPATRA